MQKTKEQNTFLSRWGFHPCDYETYLKLKKLKKLYWASVSANAKWHRWDRKQPQNRFYWEPIPEGFSIRDFKRKRGSQPIPEPKRCSEKFCYILDEFNKAKTPRGNIKDVVPLGVTTEQIDHLLEVVEKWYDNR